MTSSARVMSAGGTRRPIARAVLKLMINSTLVDCWTGKLAGFSPLRLFAGIDTEPTERLSKSPSAAHQAACHCSRNPWIEGSSSRMAKVASCSLRLKKNASEVITRPCDPNSVARVNVATEVIVCAGLQHLELEAERACRRL